MLTPALPDAVSALSLLLTAGGDGGWVPVSQTITEWIHSFAGSPLALLVLAGLCFTDAFFPPVPAESIVIRINLVVFRLSRPRGCATRHFSVCRHRSDLG